MKYYNKISQLEELAQEIHEQNIDAGWWAISSNYKSDIFDTKMMLVISELSEALEGDRKNLMDAHLPQYKMFDVELADALIRILDMYVASSDLDLLDFCTEENIQQTVNDLYYDSIPKQLFFITKCCTDYYDYGLPDAVVGILAIARLHDINIFKIVHEKRQYNKNRADHKPENRAKENGKKY